MAKRAAVHFAEELECLITRFKLEYDLTYAEAVGVLEITKADIIREAAEAGDDEETDDEATQE